VGNKEIGQKRRTSFSWSGQKQKSFNSNTRKEKKQKKSTYTEGRLKRAKATGKKIGGGPSVPPP